MKSFSIWGRIFLTGMILVGTFMADYLGNAQPVTAVETAALTAATPTLHIEPATGSANTRVTLSATGFPPHTQVSIYLGPPDADALPNPYGEAITDGEGSLKTTVAMPARWPDGRPIGAGILVLLAATNDYSVKAMADFEYMNVTAGSDLTMLAAAQPAITISPDSGGPGAHITVNGSDFPAGETVRFFLTVPGNEADAERQVSAPLTANTFAPRMAPLGAERQADTALVIVGSDGSFAATFVLPLSWPNGERIVEPKLSIIAATEGFSTKARADFTFDSEAGFKPYVNNEGGFVLQLPKGWTVGRSRQSSFGNTYLLGPAPLAEGDLGNSFIIVADLKQVSLDQAVAHLCGCAQPAQIEDVLLSGRPAKRALLGTEGWPTLEWTFVEHNGKLIALSIHDPVTLRALHDVLDSILFVSSEQHNA
jgi:hypothetical protein